MLKTRRSPHGERGLKLLGLLSFSAVILSLPPRGAWIEIWVKIPSLHGHLVAPPTGSVD